MNKQHPTLSIQPDLSIPPSRIAEYKARSGATGSRFQAVLAAAADGRGTAAGLAPARAAGTTLRAVWPPGQARSAEQAAAGTAARAPEHGPTGWTTGPAGSIPPEPRQTTVTPPETRHRNDGRFFGPDGFDGDDIIDIVNPLHHLPIVGMVYRQVTGDQISPGAKIIGGGIIGGPAGLVSSVVRVGIERTTGRSLGGHVAGLAGFDRQGTAGPSRAASAYARAAKAGQPEFAALSVNAATPPPMPPPSVLSAAGAPGHRSGESDRPVVALSQSQQQLSVLWPPRSDGVVPPAATTGGNNRAPVRYVWSAGAPGRTVAATPAGVPDGPVRHLVGRIG